MKKAEKIILWGVKGSPYVQKVMVALAEKNLFYEHQQVLPKSLLILRKEAIPSEFERLSPLGDTTAIFLKYFELNEIFYEMQY